MSEFSEGDRVRVDIPDTTDPDFDRFHGSQGEVRKVLEDDAGEVTGDVVCGRGACDAKRKLIGRSPAAGGDQGNYLIERMTLNMIRMIPGPG